MKLQHQEMSGVRLAEHFEKEIGPSKMFVDERECTARCAQARGFKPLTPGPHFNPGLFGRNRSGGATDQGTLWQESRKIWYTWAEGTSYWDSFNPNGVRIVAKTLSYMQYE